MNANGLQGEREAFEAHWRELWGEELERVGTHYANNAACVAWEAWQARAALSAATPSAEAKEMRLCEIGHVVPWPNTPYVFTVDLTCKQCVALAAPYAAMGTPPADNKENGNG